MASLELVTGFSTAPTAVFGAVAITFTSGTGTIRNFDTGNAWLLEVWQTQNTTSGGVRIRSPRLHDFTQGIRLQQENSNSRPCLPMGFSQLLYAQDTLTVEIAGSAVAGDIVNVALLIYYESLKGSIGRYISLDELEKRMVNIFTVTHTLVGAGTGAWGAGQALSAGLSDTSIANTDYALLGATCSETAAALNQGCAIGITGTDTGNLRIGIPIMEDKYLRANWFIELTKKHNRPMIPNVNSANKGATLLDCLNNENANSPIVSTIWAQLR